MGSPPSPLAAEQLTIEALPPPGPHWVYVIDEAFSNEIDARVRLFDGDSYRHLGQIDAGFTPGVILSPDGRTTAVATTYFARGAHGQRTDVVEFTDNATLAISGEIVLPPKRTQGPQSYFNLGYSADSHFLYVSYVTPAASFGVLDPAAHTVLSEVDTAGCVLVIPSGPNRVSSLCDNGRLLTVTLDAGGHEAARSLSEVWFDPDSDPVFVQGIPSGKGYTFLSFLGQVHEIDLSGAQPVIAAPWSLLPGREDHWRPGGGSRWEPSRSRSVVSTCPCTSVARARTRRVAPRSGSTTSGRITALRAGRWRRCIWRRYSPCRSLRTVRRCCSRRPSRARSRSWTL